MGFSTVFTVLGFFIFYFPVQPTDAAGCAITVFWRWTDGKDYSIPPGQAAVGDTVKAVAQFYNCNLPNNRAYFTLLSPGPLRTISRVSIDLSPIGPSQVFRQDYTDFRLGPRVGQYFFRATVQSGGQSPIVKISEQATVGTGQSGTNPNNATSNTSGGGQGGSSAGGGNNNGGASNPAGGAQGSNSTSSSGQGGAGGSNDQVNLPGVDLTIDSIKNIIIGIACWSMSVILAVMVIALIVAGVRFYIAGAAGDVSKAKINFLWVLIGITVILATNVIIATIAYSLGADYKAFIPLSCTGSSVRVNYQNCNPGSCPTGQVCHTNPDGTGGLCVIDNSNTNNSGN